MFVEQAQYDVADFLKFLFDLVSIFKSISLNIIIWKLDQSDYSHNRNWKRAPYSSLLFLLNSSHEFEAKSWLEYENFHIKIWSMFIPWWLCGYFLRNWSWPVEILPFSYRRRRTWLRLMKWLSMKIFLIQPHSCMRLREDFFPHWSILNGHFKFLTPFFNFNKFEHILGNATNSITVPSTEKVFQKSIFSLWIHLPMPLSVTNLMNSAISSYRSACSDNLARDTYSAFWSSELIFFFFSLVGFLCFLNLFLSFLKLEKRKEANHQPPLAPTQKRDQSINANCAQTGIFRF